MIIYCSTKMSIKYKYNTKFNVFKSIISFSPFPLCQTEEHPLHFQHRVGCFYLEGVHRSFTDGQKHLVLCGQPLFQVPLLLPRIQHLNQLSLPRRLERQQALTFSCQQDITSETLTIDERHSETLLWVWISPAFEWSTQKGKKRGLLAMNCFSLEICSVTKPRPQKKSVAINFVPDLSFSKWPIIYATKSHLCDFHFLFHIIISNPGTSPCLGIIFFHTWNMAVFQWRTISMIFFLFLLRGYPVPLFNTQRWFTYLCVLHYMYLLILRFHPKSVGSVLMPILRLRLVLKLNSIPCKTTISPYETKTSGSAIVPAGDVSKMLTSTRLWT